MEGLSWELVSVVVGLGLDLVLGALPDKSLKYKGLVRRVLVLVAKGLER